MSGRVVTTMAILMLFSTAKASIPDKPTGGQGAAMGQAWVALNDSWAGFRNQAALAVNHNFWAGIHHENRFLTSELGLSTLGFLIPVSPGTFGIDISHFGYSQLNTTRIGLSYGMKFSEKFMAGIGLAYHRMQVAGEYKDRNAFTVEGGILYAPVEKLTLGAYIFNPTRSSFDDSQSLPPIIGAGATFRPSQKVVLTLQVDDNTESSPNVRGGLEFTATKNFCFRLGYSSGNPEGLTGGFGWMVKDINFDLSFGYHRILGYTPQLSVSYCPGSKKNS